METWYFAGEYIVIGKYFDSNTWNKLVEATLANNENACEGLARATREYFQNISSKWNLLADDREDCIQKALLQVLKNLEGYEIGTNFAAWSAKILVNTVKGAHKKQKRTILEEPLDPDTFGHDGNDNNPADEVLAELETQRIREELKNALPKLTPQHRSVIILCYFERLSCEKIAQRLKIPVGTAKSRLYYAKKHLAKLLSHLSPENNGRF